MAELKPCPWCLQNKPMVLNFKMPNKWQIVCRACESAGPVADSANEAIDAWNRR